jgi:hypothetical protein
MKTKPAPKQMANHRQNRCPSCHERRPMCGCDEDYCGTCLGSPGYCMCNYQWEWEVEFGMVDPEWKDYQVSEGWEVLKLPRDYPFPSDEWVENALKEWESRSEWVYKVLGRYPKSDVFWEHFNMPHVERKHTEIDSRVEPVPVWAEVKWALPPRGFGKALASEKWTQEVQDLAKSLDFGSTLVEGRKPHWDHHTYGGTQNGRRLYAPAQADRAPYSKK